MKTRGYAVQNARSAFAPHEFMRREPGPADVLIKIKYCGICHSDIHQARNEWGGSLYPMVPGHEIVGVVEKTGAQVKAFKPGDVVGVGCFVDSCRKCHACEAGEEQFCQGGMVRTYNGYEADGKTVTFGGYSTQIVVDEKYVLRIPQHLELANCAPLLCAGITTYSPLKAYGVTRGVRVGVAGLGGLGHMAVKIAAAMGAEVTVFSHSAAKEADAKRLGARHFVVAKTPADFAAHAGKIDVLLDTISASHDYNQYLSLLALGGTMVIVGIPEKPVTLSAFSLIAGRRKLAGSLIGGIRETQEMLDFCGAHHIVSDVEIIAPEKIDEAYERTISGDVRYRFVLDMAGA